MGVVWGCFGGALGVRWGCLGGTLGCVAVVLGVVLGWFGGGLGVGLKLLSTSGVKRRLGRIGLNRDLVKSI